MGIQVGGWKKRVYSQKIGNKEKQQRAGSQGLESGWRTAGEASAVKTHAGAMPECGAPVYGGEDAGKKSAWSRTGS